MHNPSFEVYDLDSKVWIIQTEVIIIHLNFIIDTSICIVRIVHFEVFISHMKCIMYILK